MAGEVTSITVTEQTLYNLTIVEDDSKVVTVTVPDEIATIEVNAYDVNVTMANLGTGLGPFKAKSVDHFVFRSVSDDDKTVEVFSANLDDEIRIKLPDAGISTPDNFQINADSDSSAKIELPGATVDLSKAKLLTDLDVNSKDLDSVATITATTGAITTVNSTTVNATGATITTVGSTTGNITTVNSTNVNSTNLDVDTGTIDDLTSTTVDINGGSIDGTTVGATTSSTGRFSTLESASVDLNGGAIDGITIGASSPSTIVTTNLTATTADINAGTIDNTTIGATTPSTIVTTNLTATTADINAGTIDNTTIGATTPSTIVTTDLTATTADINGGTIDGTVVGGSTPAAVSTTSLVATTADINAGTIDNSVIGATTPVAGTFTTLGATTGNITTVNATDVNVSDDLDVTDDASIGGDLAVTGNTILTGNLTVNGTQTIVNTETLTVDDNIIVLNNNEAGTPSQNGGIEIERGTSDNALVQWNETTDKWEAKVGSAYADLKVADVNTTSLTATTGDITNMNSTNVNIDGGAIDATIIGANTSAAGTFSTLTSASVDINGGAIDGTNIGASTSATGKFSTLESASVDINGGAIDGTIIGANASAVATFHTMTSANAQITGGAISNVSLSGLSDLSLSGDLDAVEIDALRLTIEPIIGNSLTPRFEYNFGGSTLFSIHNSDPYVTNTTTLATTGNTALGTAGQNINIGNLGTDNGAGTVGSPNVHMMGGKVSWDTHLAARAIEASIGLEDSTYKLLINGDRAPTYNGSAGQVDAGGIHIESATKGIEVTGDITIAGDIIPDVDDTHDLGSPTKKWRDLYLGPGSLYIDGHKVLGSDATGQIDITTDTDQNLNISAGAAGTAGDITISSAGNTTSIDDTTIHLGPQNNSGTVNAHGTLEAPDLHVGDLEFSANKIDNTTSNGNLEIATNGTGYLHANVADLYVGPIAGAVKIDESSITVSNTDGNLNLAGNGAGLVNINSQSLITDTAGGLTAPILELETDNSGWNRPQLMLKDSNADAVSIVGEHNTTFDYYALNYTLDPNNTNGDTSTTNFAGDYYVAFSKDYSTPSSVKMKMDVYGANDGFNITARSDFGAFPTRYSATPIRFNGQKVEFYSSDSTTPFGNFNERLLIDENRSKFSNVVKLNNASSDPSGENGDMYYNTTTNKFRGYQNGAWINLDGS